MPPCFWFDQWSINLLLSRSVPFPLSAHLFKICINLHWLCVYVHVSHSMWQISTVVDFNGLPFYLHFNAFVDLNQFTSQFQYFQTSHFSLQSCLHLCHLHPLGPSAPISINDDVLWDTSQPKQSILWPLKMNILLTCKIHFYPFYWPK